MKLPDLDALFERIRRLRVAVVGDFCVDHYLFLDPAWKEISVETGLAVQGVADQRCSPGGAGNVALNVRELGAAAVHCLGCIGEDPHGTSLLRALERGGCDASGLAVQETGWWTLAYVKPYLEGRELPRFDYGVANRASRETAERIARRLEDLLPSLDAVILNEQVERGIWIDSLVDEANRLAAAHARIPWVVDSRHFPERFRGMVLKLNAVEAARLCGRDVRPSEPVTEAETFSDIERLFALRGCPVVVTRGAEGAVARDSRGRYTVQGVHITDPVDPVGAGDTFVSALACSLGAGVSLDEAITVANLAASISCRKLMQTGTASEEELRAVAAQVDYVYEPELARDVRRARRHARLDLEVVNERDFSRVRFAVFDHDGTISTLREGWERIMEPVMIRAILGPRLEEADERTYSRVADRVKAFIDQTTGVATLVQMDGLAKMVREFGFVPEDEILDAHGYKELYDRELERVVEERISRLERGEMAAEDFMVKGAVGFLRALRERGISLALASGTDEEDVAREAAALGYAELFDGGIHGATRDMHHCSKRAVIERVLAGGKRSGEELLVCGDGPVELREARRRGGLALGVASDEVRRWGWNWAKRARLVRAGADVLVPDWSQHAALAAELLSGRGPLKV